MREARKTARLFIAAHVCLISVYLYNKWRWPQARFGLHAFDRHFDGLRVKALLYIAVSFAIVGTFYIFFALVRRPLQRRLGVAHFVLSLLGALILLPAVFGGSATVVVPALALIALGQAVFAINVVKSLSRTDVSEL